MTISIKWSTRKDTISAVDIIAAYTSGKVGAKDIRRMILSVKSRCLMANTMPDISYESLVFCPEKILLNREELSLFKNMLSRYKNGEPISKIINRKSFWKHDFFVNENVLDPRPETELIIECVLQRFTGDMTLRSLDIGTGSGCILLSLLAEFKKSLGIGIDVSKKAIEVANLNKNMLGIKNADFVVMNWNDLCKESSTNLLETAEFDVIVSNPPYVKSSDIKLLDKGVRRYDPTLALDGGQNGLTAYWEIARISRKKLSGNGMLFLEIGQGQFSDVKNILVQNGFTNIFIAKDINKIDRVVVGQME